MILVKVGDFVMVKDVFSVGGFDVDIVVFEVYFFVLIVGYECVFEISIE